MVWLQAFEAWLTYQLLRSPTFHRAVRTIHNKVHEIKHGKDSAELNSRKQDGPLEESSSKRFMRYYYEELREQMKGGPPAKK